VQGGIVDKVEGRVVGRHHRIHVPGLGTAHFGELMLKPGRRRLNLLRITFGSPSVQLFSNTDSLDAFHEGPTTGSTFTGSMTLASVEGNGTPIGP
jgi:hypothetical protein